MADIIKKTINKILSLFPMPKIHPKLYNMAKETEEMALLGEINTEKLEPLFEPTEELKEFFKDVKKEDIKICIGGKEVKGI